MASEIYAASLGEIRTISTAGGGSALTTAATFTSLIPGTHWVSITPRNFATAVAAKIALNPYLVVFKTTNTLATIAAITKASEEMQDGDTTTTLVLNSFGTLASGSALFIGSHLPIRGVRVIIGNTNSVGASTLTVKYWQSATPNAWTTITPTDGTTGGGDTFNTTGNVTWTVPTDWLKKSILEINDDLIDANRSGGALTAILTIARMALPDYLTMPLFWTRWETSATFDTSVTATGMLAMSRNATQYAELMSGQSLEETVQRGPGGIGCIEHLTDAGTANLIINVAARVAGGGFS